MSTISRRDTRLQEQTKSLILTPPLPTQDRSPPRSYIVSRVSHNQNNYDSHSPQFKLTPNPLVRLFKSTGKSTNSQFRSDVKTSPWNQAEEIKDEKKRSLTPTSRQQYSTNVAEATREAEELKQTIVKMHQDLSEKEKNMKKIEGDLGSQTRYLLSRLEEQTQSFQEERRDLQQELNKSGEERRKIFLELTTKLRNIEEENAILKSNIAQFQPYQGDQVLHLNNQVSRLEEQIIQLQQTQYQVAKSYKQEKKEAFIKEKPSQIGREEAPEEQLDAGNVIAKIQSDMEQIRTDIQNSSSVGNSKSTCTELFEKISATISPLFRNKLVIISQTESAQESQKESFEEPKREVNQSNADDKKNSNLKDLELRSYQNEKSQQNSIQAEIGQDLTESAMQQQLQIYLQQMRKNVQQLAKLEGIVADLQTAIKKKESECEEKNKLIKQMQSEPGINSKFRQLIKSFVESLQKGTKTQIEESLKQVQENAVQDYDQLRNLSVQVLADRQELRRLQNNLNELSDSSHRKMQEGREKELEDALRQQEVFLLQFQEAKKQQDAEKEAAAKNIISLTQSLRKAQQNISILTQQNETLKQDKLQQQILQQQDKQNNQQPLNCQQSLKSSINNIHSNDNSQVISDAPLPDSPKILTAHQHSKRKISNPLREASQSEFNDDNEIQRKLFHTESQEEHYKLRCQELEQLLEGQNYAETLNDFAKRVEYIQFLLNVEDYGLFYIFFGCFCQGDKFKEGD